MRSPTLARNHRLLEAERQPLARLEKLAAYAHLVLLDSVGALTVYDFIASGRDPKIAPGGALATACAIAAVFLVAGVAFVQNRTPGRRLLATLPFLLMILAWLSWYRPL